jgi:hypothetical protein
MAHPYLPYPTVSVTEQVGWYLDSALYCMRHEPQAHPIIGMYRGTPEPVLRCEVTYDNVCDTCFERLDEYATDPTAGYRAAWAHYWRTARADLANARAAHEYATAHANEHA